MITILTKGFNKVAETIAALRTQDSCECIKYRHKKSDILLGR